MNFRKGVCKQMWGGIEVEAQSFKTLPARGIESGKYTILVKKEEIL